MRIRVDGVLEVPGGTPANATMRKVLETGIAIGLREAIADGGFEGVRIEDLTVTILYSMVTRFQQPAIQRPVPSVVFGGVTRGPGRCASGSFTG